MGEEEKKPEETKAEENKPEEDKKAEEGEAKPAEKPAEEKKPKEPKSEDAAPPPPPEIVLKVFMHCEGCARKVRRSLKGFAGVEEVITDTKSHKVVVKGDKADPLKVLERVQKKSHSKVELLSPIPKPPSEEEKKPPREEKPKPEEKKDEPKIVTVVLKVHMHCEACSQEIKRRILRMEGVESAEPDLKNSVVSVKGAYEPAKLVDYVYKRTGKQAVILKQEPQAEEKKEKAEEKPKRKEEEAKEENKKAKEGRDKKEEKKGETVEENKGKKKEEPVGGNAKPEQEKEKEEDANSAEETKVAEVLTKNELYYYPPRHGMELYAYAYPPPAYYPSYPAGYPPQAQMFSDENPNACTVM